MRCFSFHNLFRLLILATVCAPLFSFAATGGIDATDKYSRIMADSVIGGTSLINWQPSGVGETTVTDDAITGYIWSESFGWINLDPTGQGVTNDGDGVLGGYAWGQNTGWINFDPTGGGVSIDTDSGEFSGYAWGQNTGWIEFDCGSGACVVTDWSPNTTTVGGGGPGPVPLCSDGIDNDGDGLVDYPSDPGCSSAADTSELSLLSSALCSDGVDNDADGKTDYPNDPGCSSPTDGNEYDAPIAEEPCIGDECTPPPPCVGNGCVPDDSTPPDVIPPDTIPDTMPPTTEPTSPSNSGHGGNIIDIIIGAVEGSGFPIAVPGIIGIIAALFPLLLAVSPSGVVFLPLQMWSLFFGRKKTQHPWGTVYDAVTKRPLDPAYVTISKVLAASSSSDPMHIPLVTTSQVGEKVGESITDIDGRYGFLIPGGRYILSAGKTHYVFPSTKLTGRTKDELYDNLYFGEPVDVAKDGDVIIKNIPMDPIGFDWNEFRKSQMGLSGSYRFFDKFISKLSSALFVIGLIFAVVAYLLTPTVWNTVVVLLYGIMILMRLVMGPLRPYGVVTERATRMPLSFAIIRIFSGSGVEVAHKVTDEEGRYYSLLPKGEYTVSVEKKLDDGTYQKVFTSDKVKIAKRYLNKKFAV